jgi:hypothetical protein
MGGINCPPGAVNPDPGAMQAYVGQLATYSKSLFGGVAEFYLANANIEQCVITADIDIEQVLNLLDSSIAKLCTAQQQLSTVASLWQSMGNPEVDFASEIEVLADATRGIENASMELRTMQEQDDLQVSLWRSGVTEAMTKVVSHLNKATQWQCDFAKVGERVLIA